MITEILQEIFICISIIAMGALALQLIIGVATKVMIAKREMQAYAVLHTLLKKMTEEFESEVKNNDI